MTQIADLCSLRELYALGGLEQNELVEFETHLQGCAECQAAMPALMQLQDMLLYDFEDVEMPEGMRNRVLQHVFAEPTESGMEQGDSELIVHAPIVANGVDSPVTGVAEPGKRTSPLAESGSSEVTQSLSSSVGTFPLTSRRTRRERARRVSPWVAAASAAVIVAGAGLLLQPSLLKGSKSPLGSVIANMPMQTASASVTGKAQMWLTSTADGKQLLVQFDGLRPVQGTQVYQVWLLNKGGQPYSLGVFTPDAKGKAVFASTVPTTAYSTIAVTLEPKAIDPAPLGPAQFEAEAPPNTAL